MKNLDDETINPVLLEIALELNIGVDKVRETIEQYYNSIAFLIESGSPYEIKIDYFGKLKPRKTFIEREVAITKKFETLVPRTYDAIPDKPGNKRS